jgi:hypothetical protein
MSIGENYMRKSRLQQQQQIVMAVDRDTGIVDLSVFAKPLQGGRTQTVGAADGKTAHRGSAARSRICRQKVKKVEGKEALEYQPEIRPACIDAGRFGWLHAFGHRDGFHMAGADTSGLCAME